MTLAMPSPALTRSDRVARIKPATAAAVFGGVVGLAVGCAYLGGTVARATTVRTQAERIEGATAAGFTEEALAAAAGGLDASALNIARRHDPYTIAGGAQRDRQAELLTARLETLRADPSPLRQIDLSAPADVAQPFKLAHALDASRDLECLTQAAYYEARGEGADGMRAVTQVVLNRVRHPAFPKSVCGVVFQGSGRRVGCQFSFTCDGSMRGGVNRAAWNRARDVASKALSGAVYAQVGNATHFHTTGVSPGWRSSLIRVSQVGSHLFYRFGGRSGSRAAFNGAPRLSDAAPQGGLMQASLAAPSAAPVAYDLLVREERSDASTATPYQPASSPPTASTPAPAVKPAALNVTMAAPAPAEAASAPAPQA